MVYSDDNFIIKYGILGDNILVQLKSGGLFKYCVTRDKDETTNIYRYYIRICILLESTSLISVMDNSLINEEDFNAMSGESYLYRHGLAMKAEYNMIDEEQLYNSEDPLNKVIAWCTTHCDEENAVRIKYGTVDGFANIVGMGREMDKSVYYTYSRIMCGITAPKISTKSANN